MTFKALSYDARIAATYDIDRQGEEHWEKENDFIRQYFDKKDIGLVLDIPVGTGRFIELYPAKARVLGVDLSPDMIEQTQRKLSTMKRDGLSLKVGDAKALYFLNNESIEVIVCCRLLHLVDTRDRREILKEFARVLSGELVLQTYLRLPKKNMLIRLASAVMQFSTRIFGSLRTDVNAERPWSHIQSYPLNEAELSDICTAVGLEVVRKAHLCFYNQEDVSMFVLRKAK